ncbi:RDD family protein [Allostreptomyces psammosilenae]|uniref:Putative RDD family membrane protein YckC n=1 Tax=Allostreptomyces psammosilenae TaxID=1892865 RepID=A0A852ZX22_9ACTN|nr:RDD family protein [Allostreptomyces psammosilenae]NYI06247.1 putative RDD family membrane protein YckC [Allostreptomyces psammosilenae]
MPAAPGQPGPGGQPGFPGQPVPPPAPFPPAAAAAAADQDLPGWIPPPRSSPFEQQQARPATLGRRLVARLLDNVVVVGLSAAVGVPLLLASIAHIDGKIDAALQSGENVRVWLIDGTTSGYLGIWLATLLVLGFLYEALPTARWGRTLGKRLAKVRVVDIEAHDTPSFGQVVRRWLTGQLLGVLVIGIVDSLWCVFDRPWRQCWHDKMARTFVAGES